MGFQIMFVTLSVVSMFCLGYSFTITGTKDAEYAEAINLGAEIASSEEQDCYLKVALEGCKKGQKLNIQYSDPENKEPIPAVVIESTSSACIKVLCTPAGNKLALSRIVEIGGEGKSAKPRDTLEKGYSKDIYSTSAECMRSAGSADVTVKCKSNTGTNINSDTGKPNKIEMEEYTPEPIPDSVIEDAEMMQAESMDSEIPDGKDDRLAKISEHDGDHSEADDKEEMYKILAMMKDDLNGTTAKMQWNNWYRGTLHVTAPNRCGFARIRSYHANSYEDRVFQFYHRCPVSYNFNHCYWTGYVNVFDGFMNFRCAHDYMMNGIYSIYSYPHRDRRFSYLCCRAPHYYTRASALSGFINKWDGYMDFSVGGGYTFTGAYSYHDNRKEDRRWRMYYSYFQRY